MRKKSLFGRHPIFWSTLAATAGSAVLVDAVSPEFVGVVGLFKSAGVSLLTAGSVLLDSAILATGLSGTACLSYYPLRALHDSLAARTIRNPAWRNEQVEEKAGNQAMAFAQVIGLGTIIFMGAVQGPQHYRNIHSYFSPVRPAPPPIVTNPPVLVTPPPAITNPPTQPLPAPQPVNPPQPIKKKHKPEKRNVPG